MVVQQYRTCGIVIFKTVVQRARAGALSIGQLTKAYLVLKGNCTGKLTLHHLVVLVMYSAAAKFQWS